MSDTLNIGIIGTGFMGQAHAEAFWRCGVLYTDLARTPRLYAVADTSQTLAEAARQRFGFDKAYDDWRALIDDPDVHVVDITAPNRFHHEMALAAIAAGKHVYCEKPMAMSLAEACEMRDAAAAAGVKTMISFNNIKTPAAMLARQLIERGEIGTPTRFRGTFDQGFFNDPELPWSWRCSRAAAGTGSLGDLGAHVIGVAQYLMGDFQRVCGQAQTVFTERPVAEPGAGYGSRAGADAERRSVENDDQTQCLVQFASGAAGVVESSRIAAGRIMGVYWEVSGTDGTIYMDGERFNELQVFKMSDDKRDRGFKTLYAGSQVPQYAGFFPYDFGGGGLGFYDAKVIDVYDLIQGIDSPAGCYPGFDFGTHNQAILDAIDRSCADQAWVNV
ncbi:Gfo/Idh/MocA family protein [Salinisphaera sp. Q1T1-3]|uniref:Gfo/Idh/MocA family protein n=1 Tax=Salinisphaera sp. Q1T1-3 TaxID=2321229 RepID=UPI000E70954A|nr:Gfo/Idh/MocA family oxidoreductase [Salinisphaera sp. Q1T1-3]RJS94778.1 gfo/Idh/MocA family oxidoreductase [Salinisphaera sp. Q1T1-3]